MVLFELLRLDLQRLGTLQDVVLALRSVESTVAPCALGKHLGEMCIVQRRTHALHFNVKGSGSMRVLRPCLVTLTFGRAQKVASSFFWLNN